MTRRPSPLPRPPSPLGPRNLSRATTRRRLSCRPSTSVPRRPPAPFRRTRATVGPAVATFAVTAALTDTDNSIRAGISASANIVINQVVHVLTVPTSAVHTTAAGSTVNVLQSGVLKSVPVQTGASDPTRIQITSGLQVNEVVVIAIVTSSVPSSNGASVLAGAGTPAGGR